VDGKGKSYEQGDEVLLGELFENPEHEENVADMEEEIGRVVYPGTRLADLVIDSIGDEHQGRVHELQGGGEIMLDIAEVELTDRDIVHHILRIVEIDKTIADGIGIDEDRCEYDAQHYPDMKVFLDYGCVAHAFQNIGSRGEKQELIGINLKILFPGFYKG
jgi:hypothetical protein